MSTSASYTTSLARQSSITPHMMEGGSGDGILHFFDQPPEFFQGKRLSLRHPTTPFHLDATISACQKSLASIELQLGNTHFVSIYLPDSVKITTKKMKQLPLWQVLCNGMLSPGDLGVINCRNAPSASIPARRYRILSTHYGDTAASSRHVTITFEGMKFEMHHTFNCALHLIRALDFGCSHISTFANRLTHRLTPAINHAHNFDPLLANTLTEVRARAADLNLASIHLLNYARNLEHTLHHAHICSRDLSPDFNLPSILRRIHGLAALLDATHHFDCSLEQALIRARARTLIYTHNSHNPSTLARDFARDFDTIYSSIPQLNRRLNLNFIYALDLHDDDPDPDATASSIRFLHFAHVLIDQSAHFLSAEFTPEIDHLFAHYRLKVKFQKGKDRDFQTKKVVIQELHPVSQKIQSQKSIAVDAFVRDFFFTKHVETNMDDIRAENMNEWIQIRAEDR